MFEDRSVKLDLFALALLVATVFLGLSLFTFNPADPVGEVGPPLSSVYQPDTTVYPQLEQASNACGRWGALAADMLLQGFGLGAYYLVFSLGVLDFLLLRRFEIDSPVLRTVGWVASLLGVVALASMIFPNASPGPVVGSGGYTGALAATMVRAHFAAVGGFVLCFSLVVGGLMLCTDYAILRVGASAAALAWTTGAAGKSWWRERRGEAYDEEYDEYGDEEDEEEEQQEEQAAPLSVRIRGRKLDDVEMDEDEFEFENELDEDECEEETDSAWEGDEENEDDAADEYEEEGEPPRPTLPIRIRKTIAKSEPKKKAVSAKATEQNEREEMIDQLEQASVESPGDYELPELDLLEGSDEINYDDQAKEVRRKAKILEKTFANFGFSVKVVEIETGPVIAQYEVELEAGLRLSRITGLADDLAIALRVPSVRIVAPIPGKNTVGIEVPNTTRQVVRLREVIEEANGAVRKMSIPIYLGKDVSGNPLAVDLATMPHLLIAGRTGTGKSVCLNAIISSVLMTRRPDEVRMLMIDPKMVELSGYGRLPHLMHPVVTDMRKAEAILSWAVDKMEERYQLLAKAGVRHINGYNQLSEEELFNRLQPDSDDEQNEIPQHLPFIVIVADEMADLMMTAGKDVEQHIIRLAQKSRAVGIHLILATQKPTVDVITGLIKSNLPARIAFQVASRTDSRVVLDEMGADKLLGMGDMLFLSPGTSTLMRGQGTYLSDDEIDGIVETVSTDEQNFVNELVNLKIEDESEGGPDVEQIRKRDELYEQAVDVVVREGRGSVSLLQRALGIGYGRAARLVDFMAEDGIVGPYAGSQAREVVITIADWEQMKAGGAPSPKSTSDDEVQAMEDPPAMAKPSLRKASANRATAREAMEGKSVKRRPPSNVVLPDPEDVDDCEVACVSDEAADCDDDEYEYVEYEEDDVEANADVAADEELDDEEDEVDDESAEYEDAEYEEEADAEDEGEEYAEGEEEEYAEGEEEEYEYEDGEEGQYEAESA